MKKIITLLLVVLLCFSLCACGGENDTVKILKRETITLYPENSFEVLKNISEYNSQGALISEKGYRKFGDAEFIETGSCCYKYDEEGKISSIEYSDGTVINFEQKYVDNSCVCNASLNGCKYEYTYKNNVLIKKEVHEGNGYSSRIFYNDRGVIIKQETLTASFVTESICNDNGDIVETVIYDSKGNIIEKVSFSYEVNFIVSEIRESKDDSMEICYNKEKIDDNAYKLTQLGDKGNYILYEFDEKDNLMSKTSYSNDKITQKEEYEWVDK